MLCRDPFIKAGQAFPCGRCLPCLKKRRQLWSSRLMLEHLCHSQSAFVTLTYADKHLPKDLSLDPVTLQLFMKRLREAVRPALLRFYGVGEYGDVSLRPHYHLILFGYGPCLRGRSMYTADRVDCCSQCDRIRDVWGKGHISLGSVTGESIGYTVSYIVKNMRRTDDPRLNGKWPEFARMSLRPGIGYPAMKQLIEEIEKYDLTRETGDVPLAIRQGSTLKPLGRYLRSKLRLQLGLGDVSPPFFDEEMLALWARACAETHKGGEVRNLHFKNLLIDAGDQRVLNMQARDEIRKGRRSL